MGLLEWLVLALAVFRLVRLLLYDQIFSGLRSNFLKIEQVNDGEQGAIEQVTIKGSGWRYAVGYIFTCHWCAGIWVAGFTVVVYGWWPVTFPFFVLLSLAGLSSLLHAWLDHK
jgi:hypothetical protein